MRILVVGAGAIGSLFAGKLAGSGNDVTLLARGDRLESIRKNGLELRESTSSTVERFPVKAIASLASDDRYDFVLVVVQRTQIRAILPLLAANQSSNFVFMVNTAAGYQAYADAVGAQRVMLAFPSAGGEVTGSVVVYRIGRGLARLFQTTTVGELVHSSGNRVRLLAGLFCEAGIPTVTCTYMDDWQKTHVAVVCAIAQALYKHGGDPVRLSRHPADVRLMVAAIQEGFAVLRSLGHRITPRKLWYLRLPKVLVAAIFSLVLRTDLAETAMARHARRAVDEMAVLNKELLDLVEASHMDTPAIRTLSSITPVFGN
ncbi:MAG: ketopantoate reductase family protein [Spirochaetae bacterium HGW-Spirochaetae-4]|nr:MAG: ketopantoate reductase family protein [Spirochaetae bacterium HGW-Spirochaetae-4]